ncbi:MAG: 4Fe-4S dicluster domain-containing protein [Gemmatimonadota bacterium]|nr:4Fe-4S dicluster domain-containing protein [Gemmatimonadota bacterium]MDE3004595.1 4Fe-4S dicluster domain-containing protein [Gemmatimonadota bacterium]MDE3014884.1 4Fe-4S dicluster domain-containing protein [Gemmatimonadota bacterium]
MTESDSKRDGRAAPSAGAGSGAVSDEEAGFEVLDHFERFSQKNDIYSRAFWDPEIRSERSDRFFETYRTPLKKWKRAEGFRQKDYALRNASWHLPDIFAELKEDENRREGFLDPFTVHRDGPEERVPVESPAEMSREIKHVGRVFGADLVGITEYDQRWVYSHAYSRLGETEKPQELPDDLPNVIVIAQQMDRGLIDTVPSALSGTATGVGYSHDTLVLLGLAQYVRNLGYRAVATMNDTALAIPLAIKAGLGEYGRHGLLITEEFGPRVRIGKIFTDLPLEPDRPKTFGVQAFCDLCRRCSDACPVKAIPTGPPSEEIYNRSNIVGVKKWTVDAEPCFRFWANQNSDCSICVRVCPYNRDFSKPAARAWRWLAGTPLRRLALWLVDQFAPGQRVDPGDWWTNGRRP